MSEWVKNEDGKCPVNQGSLIQVMHRDGCIYKCKAGDTYSQDWSLDNISADIVKYRVTSKQPTPLTRDEDMRESLKINDWQAAQPAPVSNKPSWDDAPEGAKILVQSENGLWNFGSYAGVDDIKNYWTGIGKGFWFPSIKDAPNPNWRDTLEYRPVVKESLTTEGKQDDVLQYVAKNLARIKQLNDEIELAKLSIETMGIELAERMKEVRDVLNYCKFNA